MGNKLFGRLYDFNCLPKASLRKASFSGGKYGSILASVHFSSEYLLSFKIGLRGNYLLSDRGIEHSTYIPAAPKLASSLHAHINNGKK